MDSLGTGDEYIVFNLVQSTCWPFGRGFSHGYVHEIPVETSHGENKMFDEEHEAFEVMPTFFMVERVVTLASVAQCHLPKRWAGLCSAKNLLGLA